MAEGMAIFACVAAHNGQRPTIMRTTSVVNRDVSATQRQSDLSDISSEPPACTTTATAATLSIKCNQGWRREWQGRWRTRRSLEGEIQFVCDELRHNMAIKHYWSWTWSKLIRHSVV